MKYVIKREDKPGEMLTGVGIGNRRITDATSWSILARHAIQFEKEEAEATIEFIANVIDWELEQELYIEPVTDLQP